MWCMAVCRVCVIEAVVMLGRVVPGQGFQINVCRTRNVFRECLGRVKKKKSLTHFNSVQDSFLLWGGRFFSVALQFRTIPPWGIGT